MHHSSGLAANERPAKTAAAVNGTKASGIASPSSPNKLQINSKQESAPKTESAWLAWLVRWGACVQVQAAGAEWEVTLHTGTTAGALPRDWLAGDIEQLQAAVVRA